MNEPHVMVAPEELKLHGLRKSDLVQAYRWMLLARLIDDKQLRLLKQGKSFFHIGGSGHEAAQVAAAMALKPGHDWAFPYYRDEAFVLQWGVTPKDLFLAALHRAEDPATGARQMPGHFSNKDLHIVSQSSPTGTQFLQAVGVALAAKKERTDEVVYVSSGEGTTSEGEFFEAVNWAARESLPVLFFIEDNKYAISVPVELQTAGGSVYEVTKGFSGLARFECNGVHVLDAYGATKKAVEYIRSGKGPALVVAHVVRLLPHSSSDDQRKYRDEKELESEKKRDPILLLKQYLLDNEFLAEKELEEIQNEGKQEIEEAADWAESRPLPNPEFVAEHLFGKAHAVPSENFIEPEHSGDKIVFVDAINHALHEEMRRNEKMIVFGEDIADRKGGVFTATKGLSTSYGMERAFNSPLAEASIIGVAIGMALKGWKPVPEIQFGDYIWPAFMQIRDELAVVRYRSNGVWPCSVVIRVPVGGYIHGGIYHSQNIEAFFAHIPGLRIAFPSNAADAKGLLKAAIRGD
ncbi:MAG TPA: thiamine pyrophosphate-dependent enzyme, partial [Bacteroidota bacterium]|nr:thiamine pyrophosphate-dependent enzyme [Bacteroidota bacterium]